MSEFIDNVEQSQRVSDLYEFATRVLEGDDADAIASEYEDAIESIEPYDVLVVQDRLLREGATVATVKREMEAILAVVRPTLAAHEWDRPDDGHPIDNMLRENRAIESHLSEISRLGGEIEDDDPPLDAVSDLRSHVEALEDVDRHFVRKENELFPHLEDHWKHDRPLGMTWSIHDDVRSHRTAIESMVSDPDPNPVALSRLCARFSTLLERLIFEEERILFPVSLSTLTDDEWRTIQRESAEIGYVEIDPEFAYLERDATESVDDPADSPGSRDTGAGDLPAGTVALGLETGTLSIEEIELLFDALPVDVTYVDETDRVRYFNNPDERIFPRSGSIIGRTVQNCHPPESVDRVERILSAFRSGEQDQARFWIQNDAGFVVIEYYALRDEAGRYRGTLEVTQEASEIRSLDGENRLIDWGE